MSNPAVLTLTRTDAGLVQGHTRAIRRLMVRSAENIRAIGQHLLQVKTILGHGRFGDYLEHEFEWSEDTAERYMRIAVRFPVEQIPQIAEFSTSALHLLAAPSTPPEARHQARKMARGGRHVSYSKARKLVHRAKRRRRLRALSAAERTELERVARNQRLKRIDDLLERADQLARGLGREAAAALAQLEQTRAHFARLAGS